MCQLLYYDTGLSKYLMLCMTPMHLKMDFCVKIKEKHVLLLVF